jgi:hypothetical protein
MSSSPPHHRAQAMRPCTDSLEQARRKEALLQEALLQEPLTTVRSIDAIPGGTHVGR